MKSEKFKKLKKPVGQFIIDQKDIKGMPTNNGTYYHYSDVCTLLKRFKKMKTTNEFRNITTDLGGY